MFEKLVAIEPVHLVDAGVEELKKYAKEAVLYDDIPADDAEIVRRIGDADAVLVCVIPHASPGRRWHSART